MEMNMLRKLAWSFAGTTGLDFEDLFQEAALTWCKIEKSDRYDCRKSAFNTYAYLCINNHLKTMATRDKKYRNYNVAADDQQLQAIADKKATPEQSAQWHDRLHLLSAEAQFVLKLIFESPVEFLQLAGSRQLLADLLSNKGIAEDRTIDIISEIKEMLRE